MPIPRRRSATGWLIAFLAVVLFASVNIVVALRFSSQRLDLTAERLYTLTPEAHAMLAALEEPVTLRLFQSPKLIASVPALEPMADQVHEVLATLERQSAGKVHVDLIDVTPFSPAEDVAVAQGLHGFSLNVDGDQGYFGLVGTNTVDDVERIPFLDPSRAGFLTHDLLQVIYRLSHPDKPRVAVIDDLGLFGAPDQNLPPWQIVSVLRENYAVREVRRDANEIPSGTEVLILAHPARISAALGYAIDQYALDGGAMLVLVDPLAENSPAGFGGRTPLAPSSDLAPLLAAWGVRMDPTQVVGDRAHALRIVGTAGGQRVSADYLPWLRLDGDALLADDPITSSLRQLRLSSAGAIERLPDATTTMRPLLQTSLQSTLLDRNLVMGHPNPNSLLEGFVPLGRKLDLAVRLTGPARTAFPDGPPDDAAGGAERRGGTINVILAADSDLLADSHLADERGRAVSDNADFLLNAIDDLAGGSAFMSLRGGGMLQRPLTRILALRAEAEAQHGARARELASRLAAAQQHLEEISAAAVSQADFGAGAQAQRNEIAGMNAEILSLRHELRDVQRAQRSGVDLLEARLKFANIVAVPLLILIAAGLAALWRGWRHAHYLRRLRGGVDV